jgi:hypothetical protein
MAINFPIITISLKEFCIGPAKHPMGIRCKINNEEFDMLFDSGCDYVYIDVEIASRLGIQIPEVIPPTGYPVFFPLTIVGLPRVYTEMYVKRQTVNSLPPRIFTKYWSINFSQKHNQNYATFCLKQIDGIPYSYPLYYRIRDDTMNSMPRGTPGFDFLICEGDITIPMSFDTGSILGSFDKVTAAEIKTKIIKKYSKPRRLYDCVPVYDIRIAHPNIGSIAAIFADPDAYTDRMNMVSAQQFLDNGIEFMFNENSASFKTAEP